MFTPEDPLDPSAAEKLLSHPLPFWVEKMTLSYLDTFGGKCEERRKGANGTWNLTWPDGETMEGVFFALRENTVHTKGEYLSLEDSKIRGLCMNLPRFVPGQPIPHVSRPGLSPDIMGFWSLWAITLATAKWNQRKILPLFVHEDGRNLIPTANYLWDLMISETPTPYTHLEGDEAATVFHRMRQIAEKNRKPLFEELVHGHRDHVAEEKEKARYSFESKRKAIHKLGLPEVRAHRLSKLELEAGAFHMEMEKREQAQPDLTPLIMVHVQG